MGPARDWIIAGSEPDVEQPLAILLLRMHVCGFAVPVRILTVVLGRGGVLLCLFVVAVIVMMRRLAVVMRRGLVVPGRVVMMLTRHVFHFFCHEELLLQMKSMTFRGNVPV